MKRRRYDSDDDFDDNDGYIEGPLLTHAVDSRNEVFLAVGLNIEGYKDDDIDKANDNDILDDNNKSNNQQQQEEEEQQHNIQQQSIVSSQSPPISVAQLQRKALLIDQDVPDHWKGLLSDDLLHVYYTTLKYSESKRITDNKLLSQYLPYDVKKFPPIDPLEQRMWENPFGLKPGWRWDGIVRGIQNF